MPSNPSLTLTADPSLSPERQAEVLESVRVALQSYGGLRVGEVQVSQHERISSTTTHGGGGCEPAKAGAADNPVIAELEQLGKWVRDMNYNRDDAPDEIARAIENRARQLRKELSLQPERKP